MLCSSCIAERDHVSLGDDSTIQEQVGESSLESQAMSTLEDFYALLNHEQYGRASERYGGSYEILLGYNPSIDEEDKVGLLQAACKLNGFMCLDILSAELIEVHDQSEFVYEVQFANPDGSLFVLGPCCGADEETMPPQSTFIVHVLCQSEDSCLVLDLPPYLP
jgi:hypothetical protein